MERIRRPAAAVCAVAAVAGTAFLAPAATGTREAPRTVPPYRQLVGLFRYDASRPLAVAVDRESIEQGITVRRVSFAVPGIRLRAYLLLPRAGERRPGIVIAPEGVADRESFFGEGVALARRGAVVLLVDGPWAAAELRNWPTCRRRRDYSEVVRSVIELRRALDLLTSLAQVDATRLAVGGYSYSAWTTGILAGVDRRPKAFVLASGEATMTRFLAERCGRHRSYVEPMRVFDTVRYVGHAAPAALLFQNGTRDEYWPRRSMVALQRAASRPKTIRWYRAAHSLNAAARRDRIAWLAVRLGL
jgi:dienelactone hydrolase